MRGPSLARITAALSAALPLGCGREDDQYRVEEDVATPQAPIGASVTDETSAEGAQSLTLTMTRVEALQRVGTDRHQLRSLGSDLVLGTGDDIVREGVLRP